MIARGLLFTLVLLALGFPAAGQALHFETRQPGNVFPSNNAPRFYLTPSCRFCGSWQVRDYHGQSVAIRYNVDVSPDERALTLPFLPCGYYTLEVNEAAPPQRHFFVPFAIVAPPDSLHIGQDSPFALDTAFSWLLRGGSDHPAPAIPSPAETTTRLIDLAGIQHIRERLRCERSEPLPRRIHLAAL